MGDSNDVMHVFSPAKAKKLDIFTRVQAEEEAEKVLHFEKVAAQRQALVAEAYRKMPGDLRQRAKEWGVSALMEAVWLSGWDCGYKQSFRDAAASKEADPE